jgi:hypothetical protein
MVTKFREKELLTYQKIGVDKETYAIIRDQKKIQKKSMMRIIKDLVINYYAKETKKPV